MRKDVTILVGTISIGIWRSTDGGETWARAQGSRPRWPWNEMQCFDLVVHPDDPKTVFAGTNDGLFRSDDRGANFERVDSPLNDFDAWSLAIDPVEPSTMFAGCRPGAVFRSKDGGQRWERLPAEFAETCPNVSVPRVLTLAVDPTDHRTVWAGAEVDGVRRSLDGGDTWSRVTTLDETDIHSIVVSAGSPSKVLMSSAREVYTTTDVGESWQEVGVPKRFPMGFCGGMAVKPDDPNVVFVANGNNFVGDDGTVVRSRDRGATWEALRLPVQPNSPMWVFGMNPADPNLVLCNSHYGQVFCSEDAGDSWVKLGKEFTEIRALAWTPN